MRVPSSGGTPTVLTHLKVEEGERNHISPQALPGGRFMYLAQHEARKTTFASKPPSWTIPTSESGW